MNAEKCTLPVILFELLDSDCFGFLPAKRVGEIM